VFTCMMPWSFLLPVLATRWFRHSIGDARPWVAFLLTACVVAFPTCWLPAESRPRYFMSLFPCVAPLVGLVIERCWETEQLGWWQRSWDRYSLAGVGVIVSAGLFVVGIRSLGGLVPRGLGESMSIPFVAAYAVAAVIASCTVLWARGRKNWLHAQTGTLVLGGFLGLSYTGVVVDMQIHTSNNPSAAIAAVQEMLPDGEHLVSFGPVHHLFAYYYRQPIELVPMVTREVPSTNTATYFCYAVDPSVPTVEVPFAWDSLAEISCERAQSDRPRAKVVVGKRRTGASETLARDAAPMIQK